MSHPIYGQIITGFDRAGAITRSTGVVLSDSMREGERVWICGDCGKRDVWQEGWTQHGTIEVCKAVRCPGCSLFGGAP